MGGRESGNRETDVLKGAIAGFIGGLVASWTMNQFQAALSKVMEGIEKPHGAQSLKPEGGQEGVEEMKRRPEEDSEEQEDATEKVADAISENIFGHELEKDEKELAGAVVHYAFGAAMGGVYGIAAEVVPEVSTGLGAPFGAVFWMTADEMAVPLLGLAKPPTEYPLSTHVYALASHLVYGLTAEVVRRAVRSAL
jgi:putative membrane protein